MDIKVDGKEVGTAYISLKFGKDSFDSHIELIDKIQSKDFVIEMDGKKFTIKDYRRVYMSEGNVYLEGATLAAK